MKKFGLGTFSLPAGEKFAGIVIDGRVSNLNALLKKLNVPEFRSNTVLEILDCWEKNISILVKLAADVCTEDWIDESDLIVHPVVDLPRQVFCTGANYRKHVVDLTIDANIGPDGMGKDELKIWAENMMDKRVADGEPYVFTKPVSSVSGAYDDLLLPATTKKPDWELELAVIIGKEGYAIAEDEAMSYVAGYSIVNDISARDLIPRTDYKMLGTDWLRSKGQPGFLPLGPYLVPACFVEDPYDLSLKLSVSDQIMQDETTADMLFSIEKQIAYISKYTKILPGDIICTGSPAGNGTHYNRFLMDGDLMRGEISGLGFQRQKCLALKASK